MIRVYHTQAQNFVAFLVLYPSLIAKNVRFWSFLVPCYSVPQNYPLCATQDLKVQRYQKRRVKDRMRAYESICRKKKIITNFAHESQPKFREAHGYFKNIFEFHQFFCRVPMQCSGAVVNAAYCRQLQAWQSLADVQSPTSTVTVRREYDEEWLAQTCISGKQWIAHGALAILWTVASWDIMSRALAPWYFVPLALGSHLCWGHLYTILICVMTHVSWNTYAMLCKRNF